VRPFCTLSLSLLAACSAPQITGTPHYTLLEPRGDVGFATGGNPLAETTLADLGIAGEESAIGAQLDLLWGSPHLTLATQAASWEGDGTLSVDFGGISASEPVSTQFDLGVHRAYLTFDLAPTEAVELGLGVGALVFDVNATVTPDSGLVAAENVDELVPVPVLTARAGGRVWKLDLGATVAGMTADVDGNEASVLDLDLNARYAIFGEHGSFHGALVAGWRSTHIGLVYDDGVESVDLDATFSGPYIGLQLGF